MKYKKVDNRGTLRKEGAPAFCLGGYFELSNCLKYDSASYEQPCHSEEPVRTPVTWESALQSLPVREYGLPRRFAPRNDRAKSMIFYCTLDFVGQNPMLAKTADKDASPRHPTSFCSATFPSRGRLFLPSRYLRKLEIICA